jgi:hypothetical protein
MPHAFFSYQKIILMQKYLSHVDNTGNVLLKVEPVDRL